MTNDTDTTNELLEDDEILAGLDAIYAAQQVTPDPRAAFLEAGQAFIDTMKRKTAEFEDDRAPGKQLEAMALECLNRSTSTEDVWIERALAINAMCMTARWLYEVRVAEIAESN